MEQTDSGYVFILCIAAVCAFFYMIPTVAAFARGHPNRWLIMVINIAFGATLIGWLGPLVWAFHGAHRSATGNHGGESGLNVFANDAGPVVAMERLSPPVRDSHDALVERLAQLKRLLDAEAISREEYGALKADCLRRLGNAAAV